jgi:hypothetical protein
MISRTLLMAPGVRMTGVEAGLFSVEVKGWAIVAMVLFLPEMSLYSV